MVSEYFWLYDISICVFWHCPPQKRIYKREFKTTLNPQQNKMHIFIWWYILTRQLIESRRRDGTKYAAYARMAQKLSVYDE